MSWLKSIPLDPEVQHQLEQLARSSKRIEADRARAILLTYQGQNAQQIGELLSVTAQCVRLWRSSFAREGVAGLHAKARKGRTPRKREAALQVVEELLGEPQQSWTCPRMAQQILQRTGISIHPRYLSRVLKKGGGGKNDPVTPSKLDKTNPL